MQHKDIDGKWNRYLTLDTIIVTDVPDAGGSGVNTWLVVGPHRVLQMIDPNSGVGCDASEKQRYQYVLSAGSLLLERMLPSESVGDLWSGESQARPFCPIDRPASGYILALLMEVQI